jgi:hypothetical protein
MWVPILLNTFVHIVMYYYYLLVIFGYKPWWKMHLTDLQLVQFVLGKLIIHILIRLDIFLLLAQGILFENPNWEIMFWKFRIWNSGLFCYFYIFNFIYKIKNEKCKT